MPDLIEILESFNRKERFFLISHALNGRQENPAFTLSDDFRREIEEMVGFPVPEEPGKVFVGMDYHLNWVHASLVITHPEQHQNGVGPLPNTDGVVGGNQQDIDLLVAFPEGAAHHLILIEAKAYGRWDKGQLQLKAPQLEKTFGADGKRYGDIQPHFLLMSPEKQGEPLPQWMRQDVPWPQWVLQGKEFPAHLPLSLPPNSSRLNVGRCDADGNPDKDGGHYEIRKF